MIASLAGEPPSALAVARRYAGWVDLFVLDTVDADLEGKIQDLGLDTLVTDTMMVDDATRARLAGNLLEVIAARRR
jgi:LPPG:FO 2-phospho-L-lactate transferase